jgi:hypothetical protein
MKKKINNMRKSPTHHIVHTHKRQTGKTVNQYQRGRGQKLKMANPAFVSYSIPSYLLIVAEVYSKIPFHKDNFGLRPIYNDDPYKLTLKFNKRQHEILDNAWTRYQNDPDPEGRNIELLKKHMETSTGRLESMREMNYLWQAGKLGQKSLAWRGGEKMITDMDNFKTFKDWYINGSITVFRGIHGKPSNKVDKAESWSLSKDIATSFAECDKTEPGLSFCKADKWKGSYTVLENKVHPYQILGSQLSGAENEIIVKSGIGKQKAIIQH